MRIAVVAPSSRFSGWRDVRDRTREIAADRHPGVEIFFHPQCGLEAGHFAGTDDQRLEALVEVANDPAFDAVWFGRGGYGSNRIAERAIAAFEAPARAKAWLGYSDAGFLLAGLYRAGYPRLAHGPMPGDLLNADGEGAQAVERGLDWLVGRSPATLEGGLRPGDRHAAFNITVLGMLLGTPLEPDLTDHVLLLEDVSEKLYAIDRAMFHITANSAVRRVAGIRLGRISVEDNPGQPFGADEAAIAEQWCLRSGIPWLGRADIGHDSANKVVPFGLL